MAAATMAMLLIPLSTIAQEPESEQLPTSVRNESRTSRKPRFLLRMNSKSTHDGQITETDEAEVVEGSEEPEAPKRRNGREKESGEQEIAAGDVADEQPVEAEPEKVEYKDAHIEFAETVWDFGDVARKGGDVAKNFDFVNDGSKPLVITGITMSCTCIKVDYPKRPVAAGKSGTIKVIYEPHKMSPGSFYRVVQVHSNSVDGVRLLTVSGNSIEGRKVK